MGVDRDQLAVDVLDRIREQVFVVDSAYRIQFANAAAAAATGESPDEIIGRPCYEITHDSPVMCDEEHGPCPLDTVLERGEPMTVEHTHTGPNGDERFVEITAYPYGEDADSVVEIVSDVTEERRQRRALEERQAASALLRDTYRGIAKVNTRRELEEHVVEQLTAEFFEVAWVGYLEDGTIEPRTWVGPDDYVERVHLDLDDPETGAGPGAIAVETGEVTVTQDIAENDRFGPWREDAIERGYHSFAAVPITTEEGAVEGMLGVYSTERNVFTDPLREALGEFAETLPIAIWAIDATRRSRRLSEAVEHAGHAVYITDASGTIEYVNPAFERITGYTAEEAIGRTPALLNSGEMNDAYYDRLWGTITSGELWMEEVINRTKSGALYTASQTIAPISLDGEIQGYVAIQSDVTERQLREQQLQVLHRVLRHNVRNDTNIIKGYAEVLLSDDDDLDRSRAATAIMDSATDLERISEKAAFVENLIDEHLETERVADAGRLASELMDSIEDQFPEATVELALGADTNVDKLLGPALEELLVNAVEHNDSHAPLVELEYRVDDDTDRVTFFVRDNGPLIPDQEKEALEHGSETALRHGSGIGLWMVYWIVNRIGGYVEIQDDESRGTTVEVVAPALATSRAPRD